MKPYKLISKLLLAIALTLGVIAGTLNTDAKVPSNWTKATYAKLAKMEKVGYERKFATYIINRCKETARDPNKCVNTASFIGKAESNAGRDAYQNNVFGINEGKSYKSKEANFERWLKSYNKWWYKSPLPEHYYPPKGKVSKTRYCTDEHSSKSAVGCPNGLRIATQTYNYFK